MTLAQDMIGAIAQPRAFARSVIAWDPPMPVRWQVFVLSTVIASVMTTFAYAISPNVPPEPGAMGPLVSAVAELGINLLTVVLVQGVGQLFGGKGRFADALLLVAAMQFLLLPVQFLLCAAVVALPVLFLPLIGVAVVLTFWLLSHFIAELHGFDSAGRVFGVVVGLMVLVSLALAPFIAPLIVPGA